MKQYFFLDREYGDGYEVEAENYQEARKVMFEYLKERDYLRRNGCYEDLDDNIFDEFFTEFQPYKIN